MTKTPEELTEDWKAGKLPYKINRWTIMSYHHWLLYPLFFTFPDNDTDSGNAQALIKRAVAICLNHCASCSVIPHSNTSPQVTADFMQALYILLELLEQLAILIRHRAVVAIHSSVIIKLSNLKAQAFDNFGR